MINSLVNIIFRPATYKFGGNEPIGYCGVIEVFTEILQCKVSLNFILSNPKTYLNDPVIQHFIERLLSEFET